MINADHLKDIINQNGIEMISICRSQIGKSIRAVLTNDIDLAEEVIHTEDRVNALDLKIERDCVKYLALYTPVASDLRFVMAIRKIHFDLERIADHAYGIAKYNGDDEAPISPYLIETLQIQMMFDTIVSMFDDITIAFEEKDVINARKVFKKDKILDKINFKSIDLIEQEIKKDISQTKDALVLFSIIKKLERVGDLIENIAEELIYFIDAEILTHKKKK